MLLITILLDYSFYIFIITVPNKDNLHTNQAIGGLASALGDDSHSHRSAGGPLMTVMRPDSASNSSLQIESSTGLLDELEDSDDDGPRTGEKRAGRRKIKIEYIDDKSRRHITFSKRKAGIMKKVRT